MADAAQHHSFFDAEGSLLCKPTWSLVWRLLWQLTNDANLNDADAYHALLQQEPFEGHFNLCRKGSDSPLVIVGETAQDSLLLQAEDWTVRLCRDPSEVLQVTTDLILTPSTASPAVSSSSESKRSTQSQGSKASRSSSRQLGADCVRRTDRMMCCASGDTRERRLEAAHIFPYSKPELWERWAFGSHDICPSVEAPDPLLISSLNNMLLLNDGLHKDFDRFCWSVDAQDNYRIINFTGDIDRHNETLDISHRETKDRPAPLLLAHHLRQCFLKLRSGSSLQAQTSTPSSASARTPSDGGESSQQQPRRSSRLERSETANSTVSQRSTHLAAGSAAAWLPTRSKVLRLSRLDTRERVVIWQEGILEHSDVQ